MDLLQYGSVKARDAISGVSSKNLIRTGLGSGNIGTKMTAKKGF